MQTYFVVPKFYRGASQLKREFDHLYRDSRNEISPKRFAWDAWTVPGRDCPQYHLLRTPAHLFFSKKSYISFHETLVKFGREVLGCHDVSPPWLSLYLNGHGQNWHVDAPHGPFAFVFSLTPPKFVARKIGGDTQILNENILSLWSEPLVGLKKGQTRDESFVLSRIKPHFNQLLVMDGRVPHCVEQVREVSDPRDGRLVIHGWFLNPRPFYVGPLKASVLQNELSRIFESGIFGLEGAQGVLSFRFKVSRSGKVSDLKLLAHTLRGPDSEKIGQAVVEIASQLKGCRLGKQAGPSLVTLPLVFSHD